MTINNTVRALNVNKEHEIHELEQRNNLLEEHNKQLSDDNASLNDKVWHLNNLLEKGFDKWCIHVEIEKIIELKGRVVNDW